MRVQRNRIKQFLFFSYFSMYLIFQQFFSPFVFIYKYVYFFNSMTKMTVNIIVNTIVLIHLHFLFLCKNYNLVFFHIFSSQLMYNMYIFSFSLIIFSIFTYKNDLFNLHITLVFFYYFYYLQRDIIAVKLKGALISLILKFISFLFYLSLGDTIYIYTYCTYEYRSEIFVNSNVYIKSKISKIEKSNQLKLNKQNEPYAKITSSQQARLSTKHI
jgi:hypothetical protein